MADDLVTLAAGGARLRLAPALGGSIVDWRRDGVAIMRAPPPGWAADADPGALACFPMLPYSNRIAAGRFDWQGATHRLAVDSVDPLNAIHGIGWRRRWQAARTGETSAVLRLEHAPDGAAERGWPFAFRAEQQVELSPDRLRVTLRLTNLETAPAPAGLGLHPYFPREPDTMLQFAAAGVWLNGPDMLPAERRAVPAAWDYRQTRPLTPPALDNCFAGWDGTASLLWPRRGLQLRIAAGAIFRHLVVYTPGDAASIAIEPASHMNDAVHHLHEADHGLATLPAGATLEGVVDFVVARF